MKVGRKVWIRFRHVCCVRSENKRNSEVGRYGSEDMHVSGLAERKRTGILMSLGCVVNQNQHSEGAIGGLKRTDLVVYVSFLFPHSSCGIGPH